MTTDIQTAARALMEAAGRQRLERLRDIAQRRMLCRAKIQEANESRERLARLDAEYARVEAQTAADIAREAMQAAQGAVILYPQPPGEVIEAPLTQPQPELYRAGLPPERLRKVWAEWNVTPTDDVVTFRDGEYNFASWGNGEGPLWWPLADTKNWSKYSLRPHGATWARVEAMADEAEKPKCPACGKQPDRDAFPLSPGEYVSCEVCGHYLRVGDGAVLEIARPVENCGHVATDGTCGHPNALTPECHDGVVCPVKAEKPVATPQPKGKRAVVMVGDLPYYADSVAFDTKGKLIKGEGVPFGLPPTPPVPTLLDLTKLPPGTVCEATKFFGIYNSGIMLHAGDRFRVVGQADGDLPVLSEVGGRDWWLSALVPARVVEKGGEDAQG